MQQKIKELLAKVIEDDSRMDTWNNNTSILNDVGLDSLQLIQFLLTIEEELGVEFDYENLQYEWFETIETLENVLTGMKSE